MGDEAKGIEVADSKISWSVDTSEDDEEGGSSAYDDFGTWILEEGKKQGGVSELENAAIGKKAQEFGIEKKHKTMTVLAQTLFSKDVASPKNDEIEERGPLLLLMSKDSDRHQKAFLG